MFNKIVLRNQFSTVDMRFPRIEVFGRMNKIGISIANRLAGISRISGLANWSNIFIFMVRFRLVLLLGLLMEYLVLVRC